MKLIDDTLYYYREHNNNVRKQKNPMIKKHEEYVKSIQPFKQLKLKVHIFFPRKRQKTGQNGPLQ